MPDDRDNPFARFRKGAGAATDDPNPFKRFRKPFQTEDVGGDTLPATEGGRKVAAEMFAPVEDPAQVELGSPLLAAIRQSARPTMPAAQVADVTATRRPPRVGPTGTGLEAQPENLPTPQPSLGQQFSKLPGLMGVAGELVDPAVGVLEGAQQKAVDLVGRPLARLLGADRVAETPTSLEEAEALKRLSVEEPATRGRQIGRGAGELAASLPLYEGAGGLLAKSGLTAGTVGKALAVGGSSLSTPSLAEELATAAAKATGSRVLGTMAGGAASAVPVVGLGGAAEGGLTAYGQGKNAEDVAAGAVEGGIKGAEAGAVLGAGAGLGAGLLEKARRAIEVAENQRLGNLPTPPKVGERGDRAWEAAERRRAELEDVGQPKPTEDPRAAATGTERPVSRATPPAEPVEVPNPAETAPAAAPETPGATIETFGDMPTPELDAALHEAFGEDAPAARAAQAATQAPPVDRVEGGIEWHPPVAGAEPGDLAEASNTELMDTLAEIQFDHTQADRAHAVKAELARRRAADAASGERPTAINPDSPYANEDPGDLYEATAAELNHSRRRLEGQLSWRTSPTAPSGRPWKEKEWKELGQTIQAEANELAATLGDVGVTFGPAWEEKLRTELDLEALRPALEAGHPPMPPAAPAAPTPAEKKASARERAAARKAEAARQARAPQVARAHELAPKITAGTATPAEGAEYDTLIGELRHGAADAELPQAVEGYPNRAAFDRYDLMPAGRAHAELRERRERATALPTSEAVAELERIRRDKLSITHRRRPEHEIHDALPEVDKFEDTIRLLPNVAGALEKIQKEKKPKPASEAMSPRYEVEHYGLGYVVPRLEELRAMAPDLARIAERHIEQTLGFPIAELEPRYHAILVGKGIKVQPAAPPAPAPTTPKAKRAAQAIVEAAAPELGVEGREHAQIVTGKDATGAEGRWLNGKPVYRDPDPEALAHDVYRDAHGVDIRIPLVGSPVYLSGRGGLATVEEARGEHVIVNTGAERISGNFMEVIHGTGGTVTRIERPTEPTALEGPPAAKGKKGKKAKPPKAAPAPYVEDRPHILAQQDLEARILAELERDHPPLDDLFHEWAKLDSAIDDEEELRDFSDRLASMDDATFVRDRARRAAIEDYLRAQLPEEEFWRRRSATPNVPGPTPRWSLRLTDDERRLAERKFEELLARIGAGADPTTRKNTGLRYAAYLGRQAGLTPDRTARAIFDASQERLDYPRIRRAVTDAYVDESHLPPEKRKADRIPIGHPHNPDTIGRALGAERIQQELLEARVALNEGTGDDYMALRDRYETLERALAGQMDSADFLEFMERLDRMADESFDRHLARKAGTEADREEPLEAPADLPPAPREPAPWPFQNMTGWRPEAAGAKAEATWRGPFEGQEITFRAIGTRGGPVELVLDEGDLTDAQLARLAELAQDRNPDGPVTFRRAGEAAALAAERRGPSAEPSAPPAPRGTDTILKKLDNRGGWVIKGPAGEGLVGVKTIAEATAVAREYGWKLVDPRGKVLVEAPVEKPAKKGKAKRAADAITAAAGAPTDVAPPTDEPAPTLAKPKRTLEPRDPAVVQKAYRKLDNDELLARHHEIELRVQTAESPERGGMIAPWTRYDDDIGETRVGGLGFGGGKRAHRILDDHRMLDEIEGELARRGIDREELDRSYDRWFEAMQEELGRAADEKASGNVDDDGFFTSFKLDEPRQEPYQVEQPERIRAAAIVVDGRVFEGFTHWGALEAAIDAGAVPSSSGDRALEDLDWDQLDNRTIDQGFTTTTGRFVDRQEAIDVARKARQFVPGGAAESRDQGGADSGYIKGLGWNWDARTVSGRRGPIGEATDVRERGRRPYADPEVAAEAEFGVTDSIESAGFILGDGTMLDFSQGTGGRRVEDHRAINRVLPPVDETKYGAQSLGMFRFVDRGNVRVDATRDPRPYLHAQWSRPLTGMQRRVLLGSLRELGRAPEVVLEIRLDNGDRNIARTVSSATVAEVAEAIDGLEAILSGAEEPGGDYQVREPDLFGYRDNLFDDAEVGKAKAAPMGLTAARALLEDPRETFLAEHGQPSAAYLEAKKVVEGAGAIDADEMRRRGAELRGEGFDFGETHHAPGQDDLFGGVKEPGTEVYRGRPRFFSRVERAIEAMKLDRAPAQTWLAKLDSAPASKDELARTVAPWLVEQGRTVVSKAQVLEAFRERAVRFTETTRTDVPPEGPIVGEASYEALRPLNEAVRALNLDTTHEAEQALSLRLNVMAETLADDTIKPTDTEEFGRRVVNAWARQAVESWAAPYGPRVSQTAGDEILERARAFLAARVADVRRKAIKPPKFADWRIPSLRQGQSSNYREIVIALGEPGRGQALARLEAGRAGDTFTSSHFPEDGDYFLHVRVSDSLDDLGRKVLNVEEIQSDRHQKGRKLGYRTRPKPLTPARRAELEAVERDQEAAIEALRDSYYGRLGGTSAADAEEREKLRTLTDRLNRTREQLGLEPVDVAGVPIPASRQNRIPDSPMTETPDWLGFAIRRIVDEAVEGGYDRVAFVAGQDLVDLFGVRQRVNSLEYDPAAHHLTGYDHQGSQVLDTNVAPDKLGEVVGDELAEKLLASPLIPDRVGDGGGYHELSGAGLEIGGEGMRAFYDEMIPAAVKAYAKKAGIQLSIESAPVGGASTSELTDPNNETPFEAGTDAANMGEHFDPDRLYELAEDFRGGRAADPELAALLNQAAENLEEHGNAGYDMEPRYNAAHAIVDALNDRLSYDDQGMADILARRIADLTEIDVQRTKAPRKGKAFDVTPELKAAADRGLMLYEPGHPAAGALRAAGYDVEAMPPDRLEENALTAQDGAIAFGSSAAADQVADQLARELGTRARATVNGIPTPAERLRFAGKKAVRRAWIDMRGQKVRTYADVHAILRPFRSPTAERLHAILLDDNGVVLSHSMESSGAVNYVATRAAWVAELEKRAARVGATRLILGHNHPSGNPKESVQDYQFTRRIADELEQSGGPLRLTGHYVIDHETGTWIAPDGQTTPVKLAPGAPIDPEYGAGPAIRRPEDVHALLAPVAEPSTAHILYLNNQSVAVALEPRSLESLDALERWLPQQKKALGAAFAIVAVHDAAHAAAPGSEGPFRQVVRKINTLRRQYDAAAALKPSGTVPSPTAGIYDVVNVAGPVDDAHYALLSEDRSGQAPIVLARRLFEETRAPYDGTEAPEPGSVRPPPDPMTFSLGLPDEHVDDAGVLLDAPRRARVMRQLQRALGVPARTGRMGQREAAGYYKARAETIRLRTANNVEVLAHEIGHHLHKLLFGLTPKGRLSQKPLRPWAAELRPLGVGISEENGRPQLKEGFAEFVRRYVTNPEAAKEKAPTFFEYFEQRLATDLADVKLVLEDARDQYALWRHASAEARFDAHISDNTKPELAPRADLWSRVRSYALDDLEWVRRVTADLTAEHVDQLTLEQDAELLARASRGAAGLGEVFLEHGILDWHSLEIKPGSKGLKQILQPIKHDFKAFRRYAMALRALELAGHGVETGFRVPDARAIVEKYGDRPAFVTAFEELQAWNDGLMQMLVDAGVMTPDAKATIQAKHKAYLPFYRDMEDELGVQRGTGSAFGHIFSPVKRIRGSGRDVIDPFEGLIKHAYLYSSIALRHQVSKALALVANMEGGGRWLEQIPAPSEAMKVPLAEIFKRLHQIGVLEKIPDDIPDQVLEQMLAFFRPGDYFGKENVISVLDADGRRAWYEVDPELWKAVTAADRETVPAALKFFGAPARLLRAGATLTPEFLGRNPIRDTQQAAIYSDNGFIPYVDTVRGVFHVLGQTELYKKWLASGAVGSNLIDLDRKALRKGIEELLDHDHVIPNVVRHPIEALRALSAVMEEGTRLGEFDRSVLRRGRQGASGRRLYVPAGQDSAEITTNFARRGAKTASIRLMTAFWNARLQGYDRMFRAFKRHPFRTAFRAFMGITLPSILLYWLNRRDEEYYELPRWQRDLFWMIPLGDQPGHSWIRVPKPFELGVIFGSVPERILEWIDTHDRQGLDQLLGTFLGGEIRSIAVPIPTFAQPLIDNYANWDQFRDRPIVPRSAQELVGAEQYGGGTTSELAKGLGRYLDYSPAKIDHVLQGYGAGLGRLATDALGAVTSPRATLEDLKGSTVGGLPGVRGFTARGPGGNSESVERLYAALAHAESLAATADQYLRENNPRYNDFLEHNMEAIVSAPRLRDAATELKHLRAIAQLIRDDQNLTPGERRDQLTELGVQMETLARQALDRQLGQGVR